MRRLDLHHVLGEVEAEQLEADQAEAFELALRFVTFLGEVIRDAPGDWTDDAACRGARRVMFPAAGESTEPGRALCAVCPVIEECRAWGVAAGAGQHGIIAGETERERQRRRAGRAA